jgi:hypothetical protein
MDMFLILAAPSGRGLISNVGQRIDHSLGATDNRRRHHHWPMRFSRLERAISRVSGGLGPEWSISLFVYARRPAFAAVSGTRTTNRTRALPLARRRFGQKDRSDPRMAPDARL